MSKYSAIIIPARLTPTDLAERIGKELPLVMSALQSLGAEHAPDDLLSGEVAVALAQRLGVDVKVEVRDVVIECLYEFETSGTLTAASDPRASSFIEGVVSETEELDQMIEAVSDHWSVARMPVLDRNILRLGLYELIHRPDTATPIIVSEAVRLAQTFSTEKSASFVNGVLASLAKQVRTK